GQNGRQKVRQSKKYPVKQHFIADFGSIMILNRYSIIHRNMMRSFTCFLFVTYLSWPVKFTAAASQVRFGNGETKLAINTNSTINIYFSEPLNKTATLYFTYQIGDTADSASYRDDDKIIKPLDNITVVPKITHIQVTIQGCNAGHVILGLNSSSEEIERIGDTFTKVTVVHSIILITVNAVIGWIYFAAWSISFYPQVYLNWSRKSVVGLNFDFLAYNLTGFLAYGFFNVGMFWIPLVKGQYHSEHPRGVNPVQLNDVVFTLHAVFVTIITILQCLIYERAGQKMSKISIVLVSGSWLFAFIALFVTIFHKITWLQYLYYFSYIKLGVTLIKYIPQAYMNFRRKSTEGWSIGNVLLDFTGGSLSLLQMFLISYNNNDWSSIFGDPTKFGLGFFSILFDILFMIQHYCLYRGATPYSPINGKMIAPDGEEKDVLYT
ncbi:unnamed protein product, partial [Owenia fusiformis]